MGQKSIQAAAYNGARTVVEIPESEELIIPEPQGMQNLDDIPDDSKIEANTPRAEIMKMGKAGTKIKKLSYLYLFSKI